VPKKAITQVKSCDLVLQVYAGVMRRVLARRLYLASTCRIKTLECVACGDVRAVPLMQPLGKRFSPEVSDIMVSLLRCPSRCVCRQSMRLKEIFGDMTQLISNWAKRCTLDSINSNAIAYHGYPLSSFRRVQRRVQNLLPKRCKSMATKAPRAWQQTI
jgi:hypothetical protein